ncbi:MAG: CDP-diacylglycerol--glycerol-3-phosphate 3-phosphatidyltransferase [Candidatus Algichlamydia australiensis]|nr:CDP-diacylglycerol--glycerol-3-phosphate 3-phosphatidyltransferase [Chlamydiales bacterium]
MQIALVLTLSRIVLSPIFILLYLYYESWGISLQVLPFLLLAILGLSELTDLLDGYFARKLNQVTDLGKVLDPMADSITRLSILFAFTSGIVNLPILLVLVFFYRDSFISTLRTLCALRGVALSARISGKIKAVIQGLTVLVVLVAMACFAFGAITLKEFQLLSFYVVLVAALYTLLSGVEYLWAHRAAIKQAWTGKL